MNDFLKNMQLYFNNNFVFAHKDDGIYYHKCNYGPVVVVKIQLGLVIHIEIVKRELNNDT